MFTLSERNPSALKERVATLVRQLMAKRSIDRLVDDDDDLTERGLSSLDLVTLMLGVEVEFGLKIPDADMTPANFRSITRIAALLVAVADQPQESVA
jgi:acyl carrier protein